MPELKNKQTVYSVSVLALSKNGIKPDIIKTKEVSSLYVAMKHILHFAQIFGLMPVNGIGGQNINNIKFKWLSAKTIYSVLSAFMIFIYAVLYLLEFLREDITFGLFVATIFYGCQAIGYALFIKLAMKWFDFNKTWMNMEKKMRNYSYQPNYNRRFMITTTTMIVLATAEHAFSIIKSIKVSKLCPNYTSEPVKAYFGVCCTNVFTVTSFAYWKILFVEIPIVMSTFVWTFNDVFIILISSALAVRFKQINKRIEENEVQNQQFWKEVREDYNRLWKLCKTSDSMINNHVTLSFAGNLFFICWQMFNSLKPMPNTLHMLYFYYSFGYLLGRTAVVSGYCCWLNDESKELLSTLFGIPHEYYCVEADRLIHQICASPAVLTGSNFFSVTRGLCLQVASAIVTFEIILIQLGSSSLQLDTIRPINCLI